MGIIQAVVFAIGYVVLAGILAIEWGECVSTTGTDEFQIIRIVLSNLLSLAIVLSIKKYKEKKAKTLSSEISQS